MKNKRLLVILIIFLVLGTLAILGGTVFSVKSVTVRFHNKLDYFVDSTTSEQEQAAATARLEGDIEGSLGYLKNKNILFNINKTKISTSIEEHEEIYEGFRLHVTNVKSVFPNKIVVTVRERYPVYTYTEGSNTVVLDGSLRVLDKKMPVDNRRLVNIESAFPNVDVESLEIGEVLVSDFPERDAVVKTLVPFFAEISSYEDAVIKIFSKVEFKYLLKDVTSSETVLSLVMTQWVDDPKDSPKNFFELRIIDIEHNTKNKLVKIWQALEYFSSGAGVYEVYDLETAKDKIGGFFIPASGEDPFIFA